MADTIVNTPAQSGNNDVSAAGWAVAIIILLAVIVGGVFLFRRAPIAPAQPQQPGANINVTLPGGGTGNSGAGAAGAGSAQQ